MRCAALVMALLSCSPARAARPLEVPLLIRVARCGGKLVREASWVEEHVAAVERLLSPHAVRLRVRRDQFAPASCDALDRAARNSLATHAPPVGVTVLVMRRVRDLDVPGYDLMGVHWRYRGEDESLRGRRYVLLTARARPPVLAHELAHYFGLPHDPAGGNLMTPGPSAPIWKEPGPRPRPMEPLLTAAQAQRLRAGIRELLKALPPATAPARNRGKR